MTDLRTYDDQSEFDPTLAIPSLRDAVRPGDGEVHLTFDRTVRRPLRLRAANGDPLDQDTNALLTVILRVLNGTLYPFDLSFLKARFGYGDEDGGSLWLDRPALMWGILELCIAAEDHAELDGICLQVRPSLRRTMRDGQDGFDAEVSVYTDSALPIDDAVTAALDAYTKRASRIWGAFVTRGIAPWALDSGVEELRLEGIFEVGDLDDLFDLGPQDGETIH